MLAIAIVSVLGPGLVDTVIVFASLPGDVRRVRACALGEMGKASVLASRVRREPGTARVAHRTPNFSGSVIVRCLPLRGPSSISTNQRLTWDNLEGRMAIPEVHAWVLPNQAKVTTTGR